MKYFLFGVLVASLGWLGVLYGQSQGWVEVFSAPQEIEETEEVATVVVADTDTAPVKQKKRRGHRRRARSTGGASMTDDLGYETGDGQVGDDLSGGARSVGMGGGAEDQLSNAEIEAAIDRRFNGIQRCLTLLPPDAPTVGRLVIGMNVANTGSVTKVNLKGPNAMIKGEPGACFRRIVSAMKFRSFGGPDMVVHYPIEFE
ncbi:MAG: hypothetical protein JXX29_24400 [Deltaproteobacteria bacterium]|nr:hypothetical protein [Deltaproteobacteria bacterium]MBN2674845.1 hypothetical protein [Deltaproteobacteria bacterium]